jgi:hypothetical protein
MRRADERGNDLGAFEPFLIAAMLEKTKAKKGKKTGKKLPKIPPEQPGVH